MGKVLGAILVLLVLARPSLAAPIESFEAFLRGFEPRALAAGITRATYRAAMEGLTPDPDIAGLVVSQPEFATPIWDYLDARVAPGRIERGRKALAAHKSLFATVARRTGVDPHILAAIWGMETDYGAVLSNSRLIRPIVRALATLVHERRERLPQDEADLIAALELVQRGPLDAAHLVGSWAGAIGHLQVNPSNVLVHGSDGDGDGLIDLHHSLADALATSASFLLGLGYQPEVDWGFEVELPKGFDYRLATRDALRPVAFFAELGVARVKGRRFGDLAQPVFLYVPAGAGGPKFLMTGNYLALKGYNFSDSYALAVAHLADRLKGSGSFAQDWPRTTRFPALAQRKAIQDALIRLGFYAGTVDGRLGPVSQQAYARFQAAKGEVPDGFITLESYQELMAASK